MEMEITKTPGGPDAPAAPDKTSERPAWLPEGFDSPETFREAYDKLAAGGGESKGEAKDGTQDKPAPVKPATDNAATDSFALDFVTEAGLTMDNLNQQLAESGGLDAETYAKLEEVGKKYGISKAVLDEHIAGKMAIAEKFKQEIYAIAGGEEGFNQMSAWAQKNMSETERKNISDLLESGDPEKAKFAFTSLTDRYRANNRVPGKMLKGTSSPAGDVFNDFSEQLHAQADPRYKTNPAYRRSVEEKIERTFRMKRR